LTFKPTIAGFKAPLLSSRRVFARGAAVSSLKIEFRDVNEMLDRQA
jgi:hypothetical protein